MTYTLAMAADQGIQIADDGVAEVSMTKARASLTALIREVAWGHKVGAFKERGERTAYLVTPEFYEQAIRDRERLDYLSERAADPGPDAKPDVRMRAETIRGALHSAELASG